MEPDEDGMIKFSIKAGDKLAKDIDVYYKGKKISSMTTGLDCVFLETIKPTGAARQLVKDYKKEVLEKAGDVKWNYN